MDNLLPLISLLITSLVIPLVAILIKRRPELRQAQATTDATQLATSGLLIAQLEGRIKVQDARILSMEEVRVVALSDVARALEVGHYETQRTAQIIAQLRTDLDIAGRQIVELRRLPRD